MPRPLPARLNLQQLRKRAKALVKDQRAGAAPARYDAVRDLILDRARR